MALATKCPHCHTVFRVALDQLKLRGGIVRCGACNEIFDGNAALVAPLASPAPGAPPSSSFPSSSPAPGPQPASRALVDPAAAAAPLPHSAPPAPKLDLELDLDEEVPAAAPQRLADAPPAGEPDAASDTRAPEIGEPGPEPEPPREATPLPAPAGNRREPAFDVPSEHLVAVALDDLHHFDDTPEPVMPAPAPEAEADRGANEAAERAADDASAADLLTAAPESALLAAGAGSAAAVPEAEGAGDEPEFVRQAERRERSRNLARLAMIAGIPLLAFVLLGQGVYLLRNRLAADHPSIKPALQALCAPLGCTVELPRQIDALAIEQGELQTLAPDTYSFATVLRNGSRSVQAWPHIELVLNDTADKPVLRRVFEPRDYLARPADVAAGFRPRSEQAVKLYFQLDGLRASGYHIAIFYP
jgi:predicted Zn finger-like uncharacterized protein